jgi:hypothetical protein
MREELTPRQMYNQVKLQLESEKDPTEIERLKESLEDLMYHILKFGDNDWGNEHE